MVRAIAWAKGHSTQLLAAREWFPLIAAAAAILLGCLPFVSAPEASVRINVYQLPGGTLLRFLLSPIILAAIWALRRWMPDFNRFAGFAFAGAAVVQIISICMLISLADRQLSTLIAQSGMSAVPQRLGIGFFLLLAAAVLFFLDCGLQLAIPGEKWGETPQIPVFE